MTDDRPVHSRPYTGDRGRLGGPSGRGGLVAAGLVLVAHAVLAQQTFEPLATNACDTARGATVTVESATADVSCSPFIVHEGHGALRIAYELPDKPSTAFVALGCGVDRMPTRVSLWIYGDGSANLHGIRLVDSSGETHYYKFGLIHGKYWKRYVVDLDRWSGGYYTWGGDGNKQIDLPVTGLFYDIRSYSRYGPCEPKGVVMVDDVLVQGDARVGMREARPGLHGARPAKPHTQRFGLFELHVDLSADYDNPYDPAEVSLKARFHCPSGREAVVEGFWLEPYRITLSATESLTSSGDGVWCVRFAPPEAGLYRYTLRLRDRSGLRHAPLLGQFVCEPSDNPGFVRPSPKAPTYLQLDNGAPFIGLGVGGHLWGSARPTCLRRYNSWLSDLAAFKGNCISLNFETLGCGVFCLDYVAPLGAKYDQQNAARLDYVLGMMATRKVRGILSLFATALSDEKHWGDSRFNAARGGPCATAEEFFTHPEALRVQKQVLRYAVARWGFSPNLLAWELCNEVNYSAASRKDPGIVRAWHRDMAAYLRRIDPNRHPVTTSFGSGESCEDPDVWRLDDIGLTIIHDYSTDTVESLWRRMGIKRGYGKPCIGGESGIGFPTVESAYEKDPRGRQFHDSQWVSIMGGGAANVFHWWPSRYWDSMDLLKLFEPLADFCADVNWPQEGFRRVELQPFVSSETGENYEDVIHESVIMAGKPTFTDVRFDGRRIDSIRDKTHIDDDPTVTLSRLPIGVLYGTEEPQWRAPVKLSFEAPVATTARLHLGAVARAGATLTITAQQGPVRIRVSDRHGKDAPATIDLGGPESIGRFGVPDVDGEDDLQAEELGRTVELELPEGHSEWTFLNDGPGWVTVRRIEIGRFTLAGGLDSLAAIGLCGESTGLLWLYDRRSNWYQRSVVGAHPQPFEGVMALLPAKAGHSYLVQWWDTWRGRIVSATTVTATKEGLVLKAPPFTGDIACKVRQVDGS